MNRELMDKAQPKCVSNMLFDTPNQPSDPRLVPKVLVLERYKNGYLGLKF